MPSYGPDSPGGIERILAKARGEAPLGRPEGRLSGLTAGPTSSRQMPEPRVISSLPWWLTLAAGVLVFLAAGAYVGRGLIVRILGPSGEVTEIRVRNGDRVEIVGTNGQPIAVPASDSRPPRESPAREEWIVDDGDPGYQEEGNWQLGTVAGGYGNDYRYSERGAKEARWKFMLPAGKYEVFATWLAHPNRAASLVYSIYDGAELRATQVVDQREVPSQPAGDATPWQLLGTVTLHSGELSVRVDARTTKIDLNQKSGNAICADAIRIRRAAD